MALGSEREVKEHEDLSFVEKVIRDYSGPTTSQKMIFSFMTVLLGCNRIQLKRLQLFLNEYIKTEED